MWSRVNFQLMMVLSLWLHSLYGLVFLLTCMYVSFYTHKERWKSTNSLKLLLNQKIILFNISNFCTVAYQFCIKMLCINYVTVKCYILTQYSNVFCPQNPGRLKLQSTSVIFKNIKTGKVDQYQSTDVDKVNWLKRARGHCLKFTLNTGVIHRYDGFKEVVSIIVQI